MLRQRFAAATLTKGVLYPFSAFASSSSSMRNRQKCKKVLKANNPTIESVPVRSLTSKSKTRTDSFDSVCHAKIPSAAYAITARTSFRLMFKDPSQTTPRDFASGLPHSLTPAEQLNLVHREGFEPSYLA